MSGQSADNAGGDGLKGVLSATLWAAGSVGAITAVTMWAFDLGARNPVDVPVIAAQGEWRTRPADAQGRRFDGENRQVYGSVADQPGAAAASVSDVISGPPPERARREDLTGVPPLADIAAERGETMSNADFAALADQAASVTDANERREILLDDPQAPRRDARDLTASAAPATPPNVGTGAEPAPANAVFYDADDAQSAPPLGEPAPALPPQSAAPPAAAPPSGELVEVPDVAAVEVAPFDAAPAQSAPQESAEPQQAAAPPIAAPAGPLNRPVPPSPEDAALNAPPPALPPAEIMPGRGAPPSAAPATAASPAEPPASAPSAAAEPASAPPSAAPPASAAPSDTLIAAAPAPAPAETGAPEAPSIYQVQLGALDSVEAAERRWSYLQKKVPGVLAVYKLEIKPVNVGGARLYRLRIGAFSNRNGAAELCGALRRKGVDCFPTAG